VNWRVLFLMTLRPMVRMDTAVLAMTPQASQSAKERWKISPAGRALTAGRASFVLSRA
jgi:hypothetical protein